MTNLRCEDLFDQFVVRVTIHDGTKRDVLIREIARSLQVSSKRLLLFFHQHYLDENCNLDRYNFQHNDVIKVMIMPRGLTITRVRPVGVFPGVDIGNTFTRDQLFRTGVHRERQRGIYAYSRGCAYSIILSDNYDGDRDFGVIILYRGERGPNPRRLDMAHSTRALARNCHAVLNERDGAASQAWSSGYPVRVIRKIPNINLYRYDGIFKVVWYVPLQDIHGNIDWYFLLIFDPFHVHTAFDVSH